MLFDETLVLIEILDTDIGFKIWEDILLDSLKCFAMKKSGILNQFMCQSTLFKVLGR